MDTAHFMLVDSYREKLLKKAQLLAVLTIVYNIVEGLISIYFGIKDDALALFGFGADSFIETISATGILVMIFRMRANNKNTSKYEQRALQVTGSCFFALSALLTYGAVSDIIQGHEPDSAIPGIIITSLSIIFMAMLIKAKMKLGKKLNSDAIIADARCGMVCVYMSVIVLVSSVLFTIFGFGWFDSLGTLGLVYFSVIEGKEAFDKAKGKSCSCGHC